MGIGDLQDEAVKRKERLQQMRSKTKDHDEEPPNKRTDNSDKKLPRPVFRSYIPKDEKLKESQISKSLPTEVKEHVQEQLEKSKPEPLVDEIDLTTLAPRKPDWDLKRDVSKKLEKLDRRTQRAIAELIRERLQSTPSDQKDLASMVNANVAAAQLEEDD